MILPLTIKSPCGRIDYKGVITAKKTFPGIIAIFLGRIIGDLGATYP